MSTSPSASEHPCAPAGLFRRMAAIVYDTLLLIGILFLATALTLPLTGGTAIARGNPYYSGYLILICFLFFGWFWTHGGQTLGMRAWKIRVQRTNGLGISWTQALLRFVGAIISWLALGLGFFWMLADPRKQTWHDRFSGTVVARIPPR